MGLREFWAWVDQLHDETEKQQAAEEGWHGAENDAGWQAMRGKRERLRGR